MIPSQTIFYIHTYQTFHFPPLLALMLIHSALAPNPWRSRYATDACTKPPPDLKPKPTLAQVLALRAPFPVEPKP